MMNIRKAFENELLSMTDVYMAGYARVILNYLKDAPYVRGSAHAELAHTHSTLTVARSVLAEVLLDPAYEIKCLSPEARYQTELRDTMLYKQCKADMEYLKSSENDSHA
jgi:hypothetical protein